MLSTRTSGFSDPEGIEIAERLLAPARSILLNKTEAFRLALICFFARGHLLIEDIPGMGKTTLVKTLGHLLGLEFGRIQFTYDLLPSDILGVSIYRPSTQTFEYQRGPVFAELLLVDELNRASPRTQSALLQAMEERQVTIDRQTHPLPEPFFVVATQNPRSQVGTFPLPESQLDRFLMRIELGYPGAEAETTLLLNAEKRPGPESISPPFSREELKNIRSKIERVHLSPATAHYVQRLLAESRQPATGRAGLSPRAGLGWVSAAKAAAFFAGRNTVFPEDVQSISQAVLNHRLTQGEQSYGKSAAMVDQLVQSVEVSPS